MQFVTFSNKLPTYRLIFLWLTLIFLCQLLGAPVLKADNLSPSTAFQKGKLSFKKGDYSRALSLFKQARADGLNKPALFYNIGVCAYKLELYEEAKEAFLHTATFPQMAALAYYNLAVVAEKQNDPEAAVSWLNKAIASAGPKDDKILLLSKTALSRVQVYQGLVDGWTTYASLGFGYDDNVSMIDETDLDLASEEDDGFTDIFAFVHSPFFGNALTEGPFIQGSISFRDYAELNEYDVGSFNLEGKYRKRAGNFRIEGGAGYNFVLWDDSSYSQSPLFSLQLKHLTSARSNWRLRYEAKYVDIFNSAYEDLKGLQHRVTTEFTARSEAHSITVGYRFEENDRREQETSPRRHLISARLEIYPVEALSLTIAASYRDSLYDLSNEPNRRDDRYEASLQIGYTLSKDWEISGRYTRTVNHSTDDLYDFKRNVTSLSLGYTF